MGALPLKTLRLARRFVLLPLHAHHTISDRKEDVISAVTSDASCAIYPLR